MTANGEWKKSDYVPFKKLREVWQTVVLKLIRRSLTAAEKKKVQPLLQKAYIGNKQGFYVMRRNKKRKKTIAKVQKLVERRKWRQRMKAQTGKDPMVCPKCECYYEYKGEVCLEEGRLAVKHAVCERSKAVLERMIRDLTGIQETKTRQQKEEADPSKQARVDVGDGQVCMFDMQQDRGNPAQRSA